MLIYGSSTVFVQYLYKGEYRASLAFPAAAGGDVQAWYLLHAHGFAFGNKLVAVGFKKYAVYKLSKVLRPNYKEPYMDTMLQMAKTVYDGTVPKDGSEMRGLLAMYCASRMGSNELLDKNRWPRCWGMK